MKLNNEFKRDKIYKIAYCGINYDIGDYYLKQIPNFKFVKTSKDENYDYMAIGYPDRSMLWIMSRRPEMQPDVYGALLERLKAQQYDVSRLMKIPQPDNAPVMGPPKTATPTKSGN